MGIRRPTPDASSYYDDDEDGDTPPVRPSAPEQSRAKARPRFEEDEEEAPPAARPRRRPAPVEDEEDEPAAPRTAPRQPRPPARRVPAQRSRTEDDFEEEDEDTHAPTNSRVMAGWSAAKTLQSEGSDFNAEFKLTDQPVLIKFLADEPFAVYRQHFLREKEGKKSYLCLGQGCPLCEDLGHTPDKKFAFTVVDLSSSTYGASQLVAGPKLLRLLETNNSGKNGPLSLHYWEISRIGQGLKTDYALNLVKSRYLEEDHGLNHQEIERTLAKIKPFTADDIRENSKAELREIVNDLDS